MERGNPAALRSPERSPRMEIIFNTREPSLEFRVLGAQGTTFQFNGRALPSLMYVPPLALK